MLRIYDGSFNSLGIIVKVISSIWNIRFYEVGAFEIHIPLSSQFIQYLKIDNIIFNEGFWGVIEYVQQTEKEIIITGCDMKGLSKRRLLITEPTNSGNLTVTELFKTLISQNMTSPTETSRKMTFLKIGQVDKNTTVPNDFETDTKKTIADYLETYGKNYEVGTEFIVENKNVMVNILNPSLNENLVFERRLNNMGDVKYTIDASEYKNVCYYENSKYFKGNTEPSDYTRRETTETDLTKAKEKINSSKIHDTVEIKTQSQDWKIGDIVTLNFNVFGEDYTTQKVITETEYIFEGGKCEVNPILGQKKDSIIKKILKEG